MPDLPSIAEVNALSADELATVLRPLFESAAPLAAALAPRRPFASWDDLLAQAEALLVELPEAQRLQLINAHPRLGAQPETVRRQSTISYREQGYAAEAAEAPEALASVYAELAELNQAYETRFGFRLVIFVAGRSKAELVPVARERLGHARDQELLNARQAILAIARARLAALAPTAAPSSSPSSSSSLS